MGVVILNFQPEDKHPIDQQGIFGLLTSCIATIIRACPDVAVIDISMPIMDGIEATRYICEHCPHTQVIMLSMYDIPEYVQRALQAGGIGYVLKDAAGSELVEAVRAMHQGKRYFSPKIAEIVNSFK